MKPTIVICLLLLSFAGRSQAVPGFVAAQREKGLSDTALVELVQKQTFKYFWDFAHPVSGMARERSNAGNEYGAETVTVGGTGFGIMALLAAAERGWITRDTASGFLLKMLRFLRRADKYHGAFPHWLNGETGKTIPFSPKDDGGDLVETSLLMQGLLCARQYFNVTTPKESSIRNRINELWNGVEWDWFTRGGISVLYWHWSPNNGWSMNNEIRGWNECLIAYVLAASSPDHSITKNEYRRGWANSRTFFNGKKFFDITLPLGTDYGGPLFFTHYSFLGLDPRGLKDEFADYWEQNRAHTLINRAYCLDNPKKYKGYGENCWGLTASDSWVGYAAHSPTEDLGVISPTAALSAFPYTPQYSMQALKYFYNNVGDKIWGQYGFSDGFSETKNWYAQSYLAIDQGPIVVMMENYRSGLLWNLFMSCSEVKNGLKKLGFESPWLKK